MSHRLIPIANIDYVDGYDNFFVSFGKGHTHNISGVEVDHNSLVVIRSVHCPTSEIPDDVQELVNSLFGDQWSIIYNKSTISFRFFPGGLFLLEETPICQG